MAGIFLLIVCAVAITIGPVQLNTIEIIPTPAEIYPFLLKFLIYAQ